jgi:hypothetical protein
MPIGAKILHVNVQFDIGNPYMWVAVDTTMPEELRHFRLVGTADRSHRIGRHMGVEFDPIGLEYIGTFHHEHTFGGLYSWHLYEKVRS